VVVKKEILVARPPLERGTREPQAIHGPLGSDAQIGTTGARVSHGCVRMHNADLLHMRLVPAGTPIDIHA
jgi:lipoprotein-anchoring transpeptidase ErfK/SrfK